MRRPITIASELEDDRQGGIKPEVEAAWKAETSRRVAEIMNGEVEGIPLEESLARASRLLRP